MRAKEVTVTFKKGEPKEMVFTALDDTKEEIRASIRDTKNAYIESWYSKSYRNTLAIIPIRNIRSILYGKIS